MPNAKRNLKLFSDEELPKPPRNSKLSRSVGEIESNMEDRTSKNQALAVRMRPRNRAEFAGQTLIIGLGQPLCRAIEADSFQSLIFHDPPGEDPRIIGRRLIVSASEDVGHG
jgi:replication-associated recombination protein RarA